MTNLFETSKIKNKLTVTNWIVLLFILFIPFSWASFVIGSVYRSVTFILLGLFILFTDGKYSFSLDNKKMLITWGVYILYIFLSSIWSVSSSGAFSNTFGMILVGVIVLIFASNRFFGESNHYCDYAWIAVSVMCVLMFLSSGTVTVGEYGSRTTLVVLGNETDPNEFAGTLLIPASLNVFYAIRSSKLWGKLLNISFILLQIYVILLTGSRGALISTVIAMAVTFVLHFKFSLKSTTIVVSALLLGYFLVISFIIPLIPKDVLERFTMDALSSDGGSGRLDIWKNGLHQYFEGNVFRMIFGYGYNGVVVRSPYGWTPTIHNQFLQILINYGIVGIALYLCLLIRSFYLILKRNPKYIGAFIGMMSLGMTITMPPSYKPLWLLMVMAFVDNRDCKEAFEVYDECGIDC